MISSWAGPIRLPDHEILRRYVFYMNAALKELDVFIFGRQAEMPHHHRRDAFAQEPDRQSPPPACTATNPSIINRSSFHESTIFDKRLPRVAIDLNLARPVHLSIIDGIFTAEGGAGPWDKGLSQVKTRPAGRQQRPCCRGCRRHRPDGL